MKIHILNESKQSLGGGWSFIANFQKGFNKIWDGADSIVADWRDAHLVFIPSASMVSRDTVAIIKGTGKKIVLRVDNVPRNSRNRGAGTGRLYDIAQAADKIIYQSQWAKAYISPFIEKTGEIIYNGIDTTIFKPEGEREDFGKFDRIFLYSRFSRDETKSWERAWYEFLMAHRINPKIKLIIVGQFSEELRNYNFDFFSGENIQYLGVIDNPVRMANIMRGCNILLAPYFNDAYSNTIQEALGCGLSISADNSGGTPELLKNGVIDYKDMVKIISLHSMSYYREQLETWLKEVDVKADRVLDIGGGALPVKNRVRAFDVKEYLILDNGMEEMKVDDFIRADLNFGITEEFKKQVKQFDVIFCLEVFEYIYDPMKALELIFTCLKKGGVAYISFPFVYPQHQPVDIDYLRYTPNGAIKLLQVAGFEKIYSVNRHDRTGTLEQFYRADGMHPSKNKDNSITGLLVKAFK